MEFARTVYPNEKVKTRVNNESVKDVMSLVSTFKFGKVNHVGDSRIVLNVTSLLKLSKSACGQFLDVRPPGNLI